MDKRFRSSLSGYNKNDVHEYIENLLDEKDYEINDLKYKIRDMGELLKKLTRENFEIEHTKDEVAEVLLIANEESKKIIKNARLSANAMIQGAKIEIEEEKNELARKVKNVTTKVEEYIQKRTEVKRELNEEIRVKKIELDKLKLYCYRNAQRLKNILGL